MSRITKQKGSIVVVAMLAMVALISLGGLSSLAVRGGLASSGHDRFRTIALYAAESGAAAAADFLRGHIDADTGWSAYVNASNIPPFFEAGIPGNGQQPGELGNLFSRTLPPDQHVKAWYEVVILNNRGDGGFSTGSDDDKQVIIRSTGYGPGGAIAQIEVEIMPTGLIGGQAPPCAYSQESQCADNAGFDPGAEALNNPGEVVRGSGTTLPQ